MAENKKYSRISLDIAEEAEETFHVGSAGVTRVNPAGSIAEEAAEKPVASAADSEVKVSEPEATPQEVPTFKKKSSSEYEEEVLTEADLNGEVPFQKLRIGIIIVMALIVVAAVVYFNMGM